MADDIIRYDIIIEAALRDVVYQAMSQVAKDGLPGEHHFYITFKTGYPGVEIPESLRKKYPKEMTIVLQHQYYGLTVAKDSFSVTLSFNNVKERLAIPFAAITAFADPSVNFALQFQTVDVSGEEEDEAAPAKKKGRGKSADEGDEPPDGSGPGKRKLPPSAEGEKRGEVISLDMFRKK